MDKGDEEMVSAAHFAIGGRWLRILRSGCCRAGKNRRPFILPANAYRPCSPTVEPQSSGPHQFISKLTGTQPMAALAFLQIGGDERVNAFQLPKRQPTFSVGQGTSSSPQFPTPATTELHLCGTEALVDVVSITWVQRVRMADWVYSRG